MGLIVNKAFAAKILLLSDDNEIQSGICNDDNLSDFQLLFVSQEGDIFNQINGHIPQLAIIDSSYNRNNTIEISAALKKRFNIPIILLIEPENMAHLHQATQASVDSVFSKPLHFEQLAVSINFYLLMTRQDEVKIHQPRYCNAIKQNKRNDKPAFFPEQYVHVLDKQDFVFKLSSFLEKLDNQNTTGACLKLAVFDGRHRENPHWKKESLNLLNRLTTHIQRIIRIGDVLARDMGYQFLLLFPGMDKYTLSNVTKRINHSVSDLVCNYGDKSELIVVSGAAIFDQDAAVAQVIDSLEMSLDEASKKGNGACIINSLLEPGSEKNSNKVSYANIIKNALEQDTFFLHYQPIISLADHSIRHYEALLRLQDNEGNYFQPRKLVSVAEHNQQIREIDTRILDHVMKRLVSLDTTKDQLIISVNLSGTHFGDKRLLEDICTLIDFYGIDPGQLVFEMTETAAVKDLEQASSFISRLKEFGCHFGLDDFGSGYASFSYLRALPVDYLKIDGIFIKEILENRADQLFVKAIVDVAKGINVKTIAECVEDRATLDILTEMGVDFAQGYYIGHPQLLSLAKDGNETVSH